MESRLTGATFRAGSGFALVPVQRLGARERATLSRLAGVPSLAAVLVPTDRRDGSVKLVDHDTAELLGALQEPAPLPPSHAGADVRDDVMRLLLDGVLEAEVDGAFISGASAYAALAERHDELADVRSTAAAGGRLAERSLAAVRAAQAQLVDDPELLAAKLYFHGRLPVSAAAAQRWPHADAVCDWLGAVPALERTHCRLAAASDRAGWIMWSRHGEQWDAPVNGTPKLYVSPHVSDLPAAFAAMVPSIARLRPPLLKVGRSAFGIHRPDKLVIYFDSVPALMAFADELRGPLHGLVAHGVPFTAELAGGGLISWGVDPPRSVATSVGWAARESWRTWVAGRLAGSLLAARDAATAVEPWRFAISRLELDGVDTATWAPRPSLWQEEAACA